MNALQTTAQGEQIARLETAIAAQEALRPTLGNEAVDAVIATLRARLADLQTQSAETSLALQLRTLRHADLVRMLASHADLEYIFKHALTQDAAYGSLLFAERKALHLVVAEVLESLDPHRTGARTSLIAEHFLRAEAWEKAAAYSIEAGDAAARAYAHAEARLHYTRALEALTHLPESDDQRRLRVDTLLRQVSVSLRTIGPAESLVLLRSAENMLTGPGVARPLSDADRLRLARVHFWMGHAYLHGNRGRDAIAYMRKVLEVAQALGDEDLLAVPAAVIGRALALQGQFVRANDLLRRALAPLARVANWPEWIISHAVLGMTVAAQGSVSDALVYANTGLARAEELDYATGKGQSHMALAGIYGMARDAERMRHHAQAGLDVSRAAGDQLIIYLTGSFLAWAHGRLGQYDDARTCYEIVEQTAQRIGGSLVFSDWFAAARAELELSAGHFADALSLAERAVARAQSENDIFAEGLAQRIWAQAVAALDPARTADADVHMAESLRLLEAGNAALEAAHTHAAWGQILRARDPEAARGHFNAALRQFEASGLTASIEQTRELLDGG